MRLHLLSYRNIFLIALLLSLGILSQARAQIGPVTPLAGEPMAARFTPATSPTPFDGTLRCHTITWGPDYVAWFAELKGLVQARGVNATHTNQDVILAQLEAFLNDHVCLRGTMEQVIQVADFLNANGLGQHAPVVAMLHSFSAGGDVIVGGPNVNNVTDLCTARIAAQLDGPSTALLVNVINDACGQDGSDPFAGVTMVWVEDFVGFQGVSSPGAALYIGQADAALVITPDASALTGTGGEFSVTGTNLIVSTGQARRAVADVVAFRKDFLESNRAEASAYVQALLLAHEEVRQLVANQTANQAAYLEFMEIGAEFVLDLPGNVGEAEALFGDAEIVGMPGNISFFTEATSPTGFEQMAIRGQALLRELGLLSSSAPFVLEQANWDYSTFDPALLAIEGTTLPQIDAARAEAAVLQRDQAGTLDESRLFCFAILFAPEQTTFPIEQYITDFDRAIRQASIFPNVLFTIEGNMSVNRFVRLYREGADQPTLTRIQQQARADSRARAESVQQSLSLRAEQLALASFRPDQFVIIGHGIENPRRGRDESGIPVPAATEADWNADRNVSFCVTNIQVEDTEFVPLN
jgi:hypothetical protein